MNMRIALVIAILPIVALVGACSDNIPGDPEKVLRDYISAVQREDFEKIYALNFLTARQSGYLSKGAIDMQDPSLVDNFNRNREVYEKVSVENGRSALWAEKFFFTPSAKVTVGNATPPPAVEGDPVNADYEAHKNVYLNVVVEYPNSSEALLLDGKNIKKGSYTCILKKFRKPGTVAIYSHDDEWFFGGCVLNMKDVEY